MKFLVSVFSALLMVSMPGCVKFGDTTSSGNGPGGGVDISGTYKGPDGILVLQKVPDAHIMESPALNGYSETVAIPPARVEKAKKKKYSDTGTVADNAYLVSSTLKDCPLKIHSVALLQDNYLSSADIDGPTFSIMRRDNGTIELDFPMSMIRGRKGAENCMILAPFVKAQ